MGRVVNLVKPNGESVHCQNWWQILKHFSAMSNDTENLAWWPLQRLALQPDIVHHTGFNHWPADELSRQPTAKLYRITRTDNVLIPAINVGTLIGLYHIGIDKYDGKRKNTVNHEGNFPFFSVSNQEDEKYLRYACVYKIRRCRKWSTSPKSSSSKTARKVCRRCVSDCRFSLLSRITYSVIDGSSLDGSLNAKNITNHT